MAPKAQTEAPPAEAPELEQDVAPVDEGDEWETVSTGLGREWAFPGSQPLVGHLVGSETVELPNDPDRDTARAFVFAHADTGEQVFLWDSHELSVAMLHVSVGQKVRVTFLGTETFTGKEGPRVVKRYRVEKSSRA